MLTCKKTRCALVLGAGAITTCLIVEIVALLFGASVASSIGIVLDPLAGILVALAVAAVGVVAFARYRRRRCGGGACRTEMP
jgi:hypothetical protein